MITIMIAGIANTCYIVGNHLSVRDVITLFIIVIELIEVADRLKNWPKYNQSKIAHVDLYLRL